MAAEQLKPFSFPPGKSGNPNGRPRKLVQRPDETLNAAGINPVQKILELIHGGELRAPDQLKAWLELLSYCHAKPRETTPSEEEETRRKLESLSDQELLTLVKEIPEIEGK